jgi:hypothetical protein
MSEMKRTLFILPGVLVSCSRHFLVTAVNYRRRRDSTKEDATGTEEAATNSRRRVYEQTSLDPYGWRQGSGGSLMNAMV